MPARKSPPERKSRSGSYVHESQRSGGKVQFRLTDPEYTWLCHLAAQQGEAPNIHALRLVRGALGYPHPPRPEPTEAEDEAACRADAEYERMRER